MMQKKVNIIAIREGKPSGFVKAISYKDGSCKLTRNKQYAKGYTSEDMVQSDIDFLTKYYYNKGYIFIYE